MRLMGLKTGLSQSVHNAAAQKRRAMEAGIGFAGPAVTGRVKWTKTGAKQMMKVILAQVQQYKAPTLLAPLFTVFEVLMEVLIPFVTASIIDKGIEAGNIRQVYFYGGIMLAMALLSLVFGVWPAAMQQRPLPAWPAIYGRVFTRRFKPFPFPISTNTARQALLPA